MTLLGALACGLALCGILFRRPLWTAVALGFAAGVPSSAGFVLAQPVPIFVCVAAVASIGLVTERERLRLPSAYGLIVAFVVWSFAITAIGPWAFAGVPVLTPRGGIERQLSSLTPLAYTSTNLAQALILLTACTAVAYLVRSGTTHVALLAAATTGVGLSLVRSLSGAAGDRVLAPVLDTLQTYYAVTDSRWRGVFNEPSELATFSLGVLVLSGVAVVTTAGRPLRVFHLLVAAGAAALLVGSASGTAVLASGAVATGALLTGLVRYLRSGGAGTPWLVLGAVLLLALAVAAGDEVTAAVRQIVEGKVGSQSQVARSGADSVALHVTVDTWGFGVGLGGDRASSFMTTMISTVGVVGVALFLAAALTAVRRGFRAPSTVTAAAGLIAVIVAKTVATPDLGTPLMWLLLAACLSEPSVAANGSTVRKWSRFAVSTGAPRSRRR